MSGFHVGLDVGDRRTAMCILDEKGKTFLETEIETTPRAIIDVLRPYRSTLERVALETGTRSDWLYGELTKARLPVVCLDARHAHAALSAGANKTDRNDARGLALLVSRGLYTTAHVKSIESRRLRLLLNIRKTLQRKAYDLQMCWRMSEKTFGGVVEREGRKLVVRASKRKRDPNQQRLGQIVMRASDALLEEVAKLDKMVRKAAADDPVCRRLMTVPGVGPITALSFRAGVDDPTRFKTSRAVGAYFGLTPRRRQSGQTDVSGHISRMGDSSVRTALYSAGLALLRSSRSDCRLRHWGLALAERKGKRAAAVACARRLAVVMHRMWITDRDFEAFSAHSAKQLKGASEDAPKRKTRKPGELRVSRN